MGLSPSGLTKILNRGSRLRWEDALVIARFLNVSLDELAGNPNPISLSQKNRDLLRVIQFVEDEGVDALVRLVNDYYADPKGSKPTAEADFDPDDDLEGQN